MPRSWKGQTTEPHYHLPRAVVKVLDAHLIWLNDNSEGVCADFRYSDLSYVNLSGKDLRQADMRSSFMEHAQLQYANLRGADLTNASLRFANLEGTDMRGTEVRRCQLDGAILSNAEISPRILQTELRYLSEGTPYRGYITDDLLDRIHDDVVCAGSREWCVQRVQRHIESHRFYELSSNLMPDVPINSDGQFQMRDVIITREVPASELEPLCSVRWKGGKIL